MATVVVFIGACGPESTTYTCVSSAPVFDRSTPTAVEGNAKIVWIQYQYLNYVNISDVLSFFPETRPRNLDIRQHAENTNNITTQPSSTSSSEPHHERVAGPRCTAVASCSIGGCDPSVITASLSLLLLCAVCRASRARRENMKMDLW